MFKYDKKIYHPKNFPPPTISLFASLDRTNKVYIYEQVIAETQHNDSTFHLRTHFRTYETTNIKCVWVDARKGGAGGVCEGDNKQYEIKVKVQEKLLFAQADKHPHKHTHTHVRRVLCVDIIN